MRGGLVALLALLGSSSFASAQIQFLPPPGLPATADTKSVKVSPDDVVTRLMTFDHNHDGRIVVGELSERMRPLVGRGDKNGDGALDAFEIHALAVTPAAPVPTQAVRAFGAGSGYAFGDDVGLSSKSHIEGALEDLRLAADTKERALPIVRSYVDMVEHAARADLINQMEPLLTPAQLASLTALLNAEQRRQITVRTNIGDNRVFIVSGGGDLAKRVEAMQLGAPKSEQARAAIDQFKSRIRLGTEPERSGLLTQLKDILSAEELDNYRAALGRRPVVANGFTIAAVNDLVIRSREIIDVVRPAVLIERSLPVGTVSR